MKWFKFKEWVKVKLHDNSLWSEDLKVIEGMYGSSVGSYFRFLRFLFLLNLLVSIIIVLVLMLPEMLFGDATADRPISASASSSTSPNATSFRALDWLTGSGWLSETKLYYGGYNARILNATNSSLSYDMAQTYFYTISASFILYLIVILIKIFTMYRQNYIDTDPDFLNASFSVKVFSAWDFHITEEKAAVVKHRSIYNELMEMLDEYLVKDDPEGVLVRVLRRVGLFLVWFVLVAFVLLVGAALYFLLKKQFMHIEDDLQYSGGYWSQSCSTLVYPLVVALIMAVVPLVFESIGRMERYSKPRYELYATLIRVFLLESMILVVLVVFWYSHSAPVLKDELTYSSLSHSFLRPLHPPHQSPTGVATPPFPSPQPPRANATATLGAQCWETALGEEIYRLVVMDAFLILVSTLAVDSIKPVLVRRGHAKETLLEFGIPGNTLHIIYNQTLLWAGLFFCPLLPVIVTLKFGLLFYLKKWSVMRHLRPMDRPWRSSQTETLFYSLTLLSLILAYFSFGFIIARGYSSKSCGPFAEESAHYLEVVFKYTGTGSKQALIKALSFFVEPLFVFAVIVALGIAVYVIRNVSEGTSEVVLDLRRQLHMNMDLRTKLKKHIEKVKKGEYSGHRLLSPRLKARSRSRSSSPEPNKERKRLGNKSSFVFTSHGAGGSNAVGPMEASQSETPL